MKKFLVICGLLVVAPVFANVYYFDGEGNSSFVEGEAYTRNDHIEVIKKDNKNKKSNVNKTNQTNSTTKSTKKKHKKKRLKAV